MLGKALVHMLPTYKHRVGGLNFCSKLNLLQITQSNSYLSDHPDDLRDWQPQHLYFTTDEEVQQGDYYLNKNNELCKYGDWGITTPLSTHKKIMGWRKIVATTNPDLWGNPKGECRGDLELLGGDGESGEDMSEPLFMRCRKCGEEDFYNERTAARGCHYTSTKDIVKGVAKIDTDFIEAYVREQGKITEVMLEYEDVNPYSRHGNEVMNFPDYKLKLRNDGTVIIHRVKPRVYTLEDMKNAFQAGVDLSCADAYGWTEEEWQRLSKFKPFESEEDWFNKNYPE